MQAQRIDFHGLEQSANHKTEPSQRIVKVRRDYNTWVANESIEDYALRFTPRSFRKWSIFRVTNTALSAISFLVLEAIGGTMAVNYGSLNALFAILAVGLIIFVTALPISFYAAKYGLDMDLLTRGAGFGYIGSTITSFIYASFTFILFALEAAIMAYALELYFGMPLYLGYLISALVVIPMVIHGVTLINRIQMFTQPIWITLMALPLIAILYQDPAILDRVFMFAGQYGISGQFDWLLFGAATSIGLALIPQIGEQVDILRFMPPKTVENKSRWNLGVLLAGPGWIFIGMLKMAVGVLLAYIVIQNDLSFFSATNPVQMYLVGFRYLFESPAMIMAMTTLFVVVSQVKINMTNAYAGSLAWSNFFARLTHSHPGRIVWLFFNALIAIILMEMDVFEALEEVLGLYANIAIAWISAVVADLIINKPLGLSPKGIEFKRAYLYDINPVGVGAMLLASILSIIAFSGMMGTVAQAFSPIIAMVSSLILAPLIAWLTKGKYYLARTHYHPMGTKNVLLRCVVCEREYESDDMAHCPAYRGSICSLCCCLDARCHDTCKPHARISNQWLNFNHKIFPVFLWPFLKGGIAHYLLIMTIALIFFALTLGLIYYHEIKVISHSAPELLEFLKSGYQKVFVVLLFASGIVAWWLVLTNQSRRVAQEESNRQTGLLLQEIESHKKTDAELQQAKINAELANQAKSRYITGISHELRTPLNSILGYAQLLTGDETIPDKRRPAIKVIHRSGEHLLSLIEGTLDIARIESGKLTFDIKPLRFNAFIEQIISMFKLQAENKGLIFNEEIDAELPDWVRADQKRLTQILINLLGNAVKFTKKGEVTFKVHYARDIAYFEINDTGPGIKESERERIFEPFSRGSAAHQSDIGGTGLGLTISKLLTELMGGELELTSIVGKGTTFKIRLFLSEISSELIEEPSLNRHPVGYLGLTKKVLVVDNEKVDRELIKNILSPLGFEVYEAASGKECVDIYQSIQPDAILMDLAMPFMDGWEASYIIKKTHQSNIPIAIVSANAFDKSLDNAAGIPEKDFIVKPVNVDELLNWLGRSMSLEWVSAPPKPIENSTEINSKVTQLNDQKFILPEDDLNQLLSLVDVGYIKGINKVLDQMALEIPNSSAFVDKMRDLTSRFQLNQLKECIKSLR